MEATNGHNEPDSEEFHSFAENEPKQTPSQHDDDVLELEFEQVVETDAEKQKRSRIELKLSSQSLDEWRELAQFDHGLVNDEIRKKIWPLLLEIDTNIAEAIPTLDELKTHSEYQQVILDVNRSLKRFPPGIPYEQRLALQDQLTVLILRVIIKYPDLNYYQGYHDVAITFLLVVGEEMAYRIMTRLSTNHLRECMEPTMEQTSYRLNFIYPIVEQEHPPLHEYLERASVGTIFALPWYLTWFGHSLTRYRDVVRLYDYFLASPPLAPIYVAASLVIYRADDIFQVDCDMASIHSLLTNIPDDVSFEIVLENASELYKKYPPEQLEKWVEIRVQKEKEMRVEYEKSMKKLRAERQLRQCNLVQRQIHMMRKFITTWLPHSGFARMLLAGTTVAIAAVAYYRGDDILHNR